jgi:hypothetical protein
MSKERGFVDTYVLGNADDLPSTNRLLVLSRVTHWVCFAVAVVGILKFATIYLGSGEMWAQPPDKIIAVVQVVANEFLWLFVAGVGLIGAFVSWLNTDVLMNRKVLLQNATLTSGQAVVQSAETSAAATPAGV